MILARQSFGWRPKMSNNTTKPEMSPNHNGPKGYRDTITQVRLRVELLNGFIDAGAVPNGFTAHRSVAALLAYSSGDIESRSYPAIHAKQQVPIQDMDPDYKGKPSGKADCKDYLKMKIQQLREILNKEQSTDYGASQDDLVNIVPEGKPKPKTKGELRNTITEQTVIIESLAREILKQRSANNYLVSLLKERDKSGRSLGAYNKQHQESLCEHRVKLTSSLRSLIINLDAVATELDEVFSKNIDDNVVSLWRNSDGDR